MNGHTASMWKKNWEFLAVRRVGAWWPFASVMLTVRFPITWLGVGWEPGLPAVWAWIAYLNPLFELNPQTPKRCHMDLWSARLVLIHLHRHRHHTSLLQQHPEFRVSVLSFLSMVLFLWRAACCPFSIKQRAAFQLSVLSKYFVRVALLFSPLAPPSGCLGYCLTWGG
jgi:hypothetical protein